MQLTTGPPLLFALGVRIFINYLNPEHTQSTPDHLLVGVWQGVLLYHSLIHIPDWVLGVGLAIGAKFLFEFVYGSDTTKCASTLLGVALGVLVTGVLSQLFEDSTYSETHHDRLRVSSSSGAHAAHTTARDAPEPSRRLRLVSFGHRSSGHRQSHRHSRNHEVEERRGVASPVPTLAYSIDTAPSISIDSVSSSIDPTGRMTPAEREVAVLRARASLADSERRRFKEERKWALSQGNRVRANQLAWQVKRFTALMESFHREADAKVVEAARVTAPQTTAPVAGPSTSARKSSQTFPAGASNGPDDRPIVSVTVGASPRHRKRSSGNLRPAIHLHGQRTTGKRV